MADVIDLARIRPAEPRPDPSVNQMPQETEYHVNFVSAHLRALAAASKGRRPTPAALAAKCEAAVQALLDLGVAAERLIASGKADALPFKDGDATVADLTPVAVRLLASVPWLTADGTSLNLEGSVRSRGTDLRLARARPH